MSDHVHLARDQNHNGGKSFINFVAHKAHRINRAHERRPCGAIGSLYNERRMRCLGSLKSARCHRAGV